MKEETKMEPYEGYNLEAEEAWVVHDMIRRKWTPYSRLKERNDHENTCIENLHFPGFATFRYNNMFLLLVN